MAFVRASLSCARVLPGRPQVRSHFSWPLLLLPLLWAPTSAALAQAATGGPTGSAGNSKTRVFVAADFARFAPRTALDMLREIPGFTIRQADQERGLGQASENVLINGARINNKSGGAVDELSRVPAASVDRIEIVEAATLGIAGLTGQVANVIVRVQARPSGQFEWNPTFRAHYAKPEPLGGSVSYSGKSGAVDYNLSVTNNFGRGGFGGPVAIFDGGGVLTESRHEVYHSEFEQPKLQAKFAIDAPGSSVAILP